MLKEQVEKKAVGDPRNESARGSTKIYNLESHEDRAAFLKLVGECLDLDVEWLFLGTISIMTGFGNFSLFYHKRGMWSY